MSTRADTVLIPPDELVERLWTELQLVPGIAAGGVLREAWPSSPAALQALERAPWPAGHDVEPIFAALGSRHSKGEAWLRNELSKLSRYERKGGGLEVEAPPVPHGLRPRQGVEWGCGRRDCLEWCYELDATHPPTYVAHESVSATLPSGERTTCTLART